MNKILEVLEGPRYIGEQITERCQEVYADVCLFEINNTALRKQLVFALETALAEIKAAHNSIVDFKVKCDDELNPPSVLDSSDLHCGLAWKIRNEFGEIKEYHLKLTKGCLAS